MDKKPLIRKCLTIGIILLFVGITINPITGSFDQSDDCYPIFKGTPGRNGWYISPLIVTFIYDSINVTDIQSWLNESWIPYNGPFNITELGELPLFKWRYHDKAAGSEWINDQCHCPITPDFDKPSLNINIQRKGFFFWKKYIVTADAYDSMSGMAYVNFYLNGELKFNDTDFLYQWILKPVPRRQTLTFKVVAYDFAGNSNDNEIIKPNLVLGSLSNVVGSESSQGCGCGDPPCWPVLSGTIGDNNWYVSSVFVGFNGSFYEINYRIDGGGWQTYTAPFGITNDGVHLFEWYCDDNMSNIGSIEIKLDKTKPVLALNYTWEGNPWSGYALTFNAEASDAISGMNRTEFYFNEVLQKIIVGPGPKYAWDYPCWYQVRGFIRNPEITEEYVKFYARLVRVSGTPSFLPNGRIYAIAYDNAGNWIKQEPVTPTFRMPVIKPGFYLFRDVILPSSYTGIIGDYFVWANFYNN